MSQSYALEKGAVRCYQAVGTTDINTSSTSYVDMADMSVTFTLKQKKDVMIFFQAPIQKRDGQFDVRLVVDGANRNTTGLYHHDGSNGNEYTRVPTSLNWKENLAAGQHTVKIQWKVSGGNAAYSGTGTTSPNAGGARVLQVLELGAEQENPFNYGTSDILHLRHQVSSATAGGNLTLGGWRTRPLNSVVTNGIPGSSLSSNQITLPAGTYFIDAVSHVSFVGRHKAKLYNVTGAADLLIGSSGYVGYPGTDHATSGESHVIGHFTLTGTSILEVQHYAVDYTDATSGFGYPASVPSTDEVYANVVITKVT